MTRWWVCKNGNQPSYYIYTFIYRHKLIASDRTFTVYKTLTNSRACPRNEPCSIRTITNPDKPRIEPGPFSAYYRHLMTKPYKGSRFWCDFEHQLMPLLCNTTRQSSCIKCGGWTYFVIHSCNNTANYSFVPRTLNNFLLWGFHHTL